MGVPGVLIESVSVLTKAVDCNMHYFVRCNLL